MGTAVADRRSLVCEKDAVDVTPAFRLACGSQGVLPQNDSHGIHDGVDSFNAVEVGLDHVLARQLSFSNVRRQACSAPLPEGKMCGRTHDVSGESLGRSQAIG